MKLIGEAHCPFPKKLLGDEAVDTVESPTFLKRHEAVQHSLNIITAGGRGAYSHAGPPPAGTTQV